MLHLIEAELERAARRQKVVRFWRALGVWVLLASAVGFLIRWLTPEERPGLWLLIPSAVAMAGWMVAWRKVAAKSDLHGVAQEVEQCYPELDGRLLTTFSLAGRPSPLSYLETRVLEETLQHARRANWGDIVSIDKLRLARAGGLAALACCGLALWGLRPGMGTGTATGTSRLAGVVVEPGTVSLERGSSLIVLARFPEGDLPSTVELVMQSLQGTNAFAGSTAARTTERRLSLTKTLNDPVFGISLPSVEESFVYRLEYGGNRSTEFTVTVFEYPRLAQANAEVTFPDYTGLEPKRIENTKRISAVEGARVRLEFVLNKPAAQALLVSDGPEEPIALTIGSNQPLAELSELTLRTNRTYELRLADAEGRTNKAPERFVFEALKNRVPELRITLPKGDVRPLPIEELPLAGTVWDDFGLESYGIAYGLPGRELVFVELGGKASTPEKRPFKHMLRLEELGVEPDQLVSYFLWADDIGPNGEKRRSTSDLFFAEIRPYEEVFREAAAGQSGGQGGAQGGGESQAGKLAETQKQIINATWNLQRSRGFTPGTATRKASPDNQSQIAPRHPAAMAAGLTAVAARVFGQARRDGQGRGGGGVELVHDYGKDLETLRQVQEQILSQARSALDGADDPKLSALLRTVVEAMTRSESAFREAAKAPERLGEALRAQQEAYEALLKLQEHEFQVSRRQRGAQGQSGGGRQDQMREQLDQMDLAQSEDRYETQRQAERPRSQEQKEDLLAMNRLQELARRQQDLNRQFKELQLELQQAQTEVERAEALRKLKKLQEDQEQVLNDVDELRQRLERPENQSRTAEQRKQLEQTRREVQRAAEAASQGSPSQALAAGSRAERQMQEMRDDMRNRSASQFSDDLRDMRQAARELSRQQEEMLKRMDQPGTRPQKTLSETQDREALLQQITEQRERLTNLVHQARELSQDAEPSEPLLSRDLYEAVRDFSQETARDVAQAQEQLLNRGMMTRKLLDQLRDPTTEPGAKLLDIMKEMTQQDFGGPAREAAEQARRGIENLRKGVEQAAKNVLGNDTEALRMAEQELQQLAHQLEQEIANQNSGTNGAAGPIATFSGGEGASQSGLPADASESVAAEPQSEQEFESGRNSPGGENRSERSREAQGARASQTQPANETNQPGESSAGAQPGQSPTGTGSDRMGGTRSHLREGHTGATTAGGAEGGDLSGTRRRSAERLLDEMPGQAGPLTGDDFADWSERLRDVEDLVEDAGLRNDVASARERAREMRQAFKRERQKPDWAVVRLQLLEPLAEVRRSILEELARRESRENLVPIDRDPVPARYSDLVKRYYENLGREVPANP